MNHQDLFPHSPVLPHVDNSINRKLIEIDPIDSEILLSTRNRGNRCIRRNVVARIKNDIIAGKYLPTHQAIAFDKEGNLQDGQHRLAAICSAKKPVASWVQFNQDPSYFTVLDSGTARLVSDNLAHFGIPRATIVAPGIKNFILYNRHPERTWSNIVFPTTSDILSAYQNDSALIDQLSLACQEARKSYKLLNQSALLAACLLFIYEGYSMDTVLLFCEYMSNGSNLSASSPILAYRNYLANSRERVSNPNLQQHSLNCIIKVWNYSLTNIALKQFKPPKYPPMTKIHPAALF